MCRPTVIYTTEGSNDMKIFERNNGAMWCCSNLLTKHKIHVQFSLALQFRNKFFFSLVQCISLYSYLPDVRYQPRTAVWPDNSTYNLVEQFFVVQVEEKGGCEKAQALQTLNSVDNHERIFTTDGFCLRLKVKHFQENSDLAKQKMCNMTNQFKFRFHPL